MIVTIPLRTVSGANMREHYRVKAARVKAERWATKLALCGWTPPPLANVKLDACPLLTVRMTRHANSAGLDDDNLRSALKHVRDQVAAWLGIDDRDPRVAWAYGQARGNFAVVVELEPGESRG